MEACRKIFIEPNGLNVRVRRIPHGTNEIIVHGSPVLS
jgi:hypothetical protein